MCMAEITNKRDINFLFFFLQISKRKKNRERERVKAGIYLQRKI
jgi:hypothetical protein